jgi:hypothetical protein
MMSANRPNGTMKTAVANKYAYVIQPSVTAFIWNCASIEGRAMVMEEPVNGTRNDERRCNKENDLLLAFIDPAHRFHYTMDWLKAHNRKECPGRPAAVLYGTVSPVR